jgi:NADPH:quinone reductase-like Zn-dependent oxidoreductase
MQAIEIYSYGKSKNAFRFTEKEIPECEPDEIVIKVEKFGINYADVLARKGMYKDAPPIPFTPGYETVGQVHQLGSEVRGFKTGDRILAFTRFGAYAEFCVTKAAACVAIDNENTDKMLALATQYCTAYHAFYNAYVPRKAEHVLIHAAAGGVGIALCDLAKIEGCIVTAVTSSTEKIDFLKQRGITHFINYKNQDFETAFLLMHNGKRPDAIFDSIGGKTFKKGLRLLAYGGSMVTFGAADRKKGFFNLLKLAFGFGFIHPVTLLMKSKKVCGVNMLRIADNKPEVLADCMKACVKLFEEGKINPHIGKVYKAKDIALAHEFLESGKSMGKLVIEW